MSDIGGSHISASTFDIGTSQIGEVAAVPLASEGTVEQFVEAFGSLAAQLLPHDTAPAGLSLAMPNPFDYAHGISYMKHKFEHLYGVDLRAALSAHLSCSENSIHFLNDAAAYLLGEYHQGAAQGVRRCVVLTLGTGIGSSFAVDGEALLEGTGVPAGGEIWNFPYSGGIVEDFVSTRSIQATYKELTGRQAEVRDISARAAHELAARETFERMGRSLGSILQATCTEFAPEVIVFGGGISQSAPLFLPATRAQLDGWKVDLRISTLMAKAPLVGAGVSWLRSHAPAVNSLRSE